MDIEKRLSNLENLVNALIKRIDKDKFYSDADSAGIRQSVSSITPYTESKTAYIDDTQVVFDNVPCGNVLVYADTAIKDWQRTANGLVVLFAEPLKEATTVTVSIS
jgi:hypothetical protein